MKQINKVEWQPGNLLYPLPAVMVSCGSNPEEYNIITISWTGTINTNPPMIYISVRPERHSYEIIKKNKAFVINLTTDKLAYATDFNGIKSGKDMNKFQETRLTPVPTRKINSVLIGESPVNIECKVTQIIPLGSHDMFIAEVININVDEKLIDPKTKKLRLDKANLLSYSHGFYYILGKRIGHFGWSVKKNKSESGK
ncbi:MAG: flavin reductase family protein [Bacteroidales bacterium]|nr:flavin reductase family protein [Bacteroidales bacterium]